LTRRAADAEAKLMLASDVTVPSNGFVFRDARPHQQFQAIRTNHMGLLLVARIKDNNVAVYDDHLFFPSIPLSDTIKKIVVL
jgi:hypothetical protein